MFTALLRETPADAACAAVEALARVRFALGPEVHVMALQQATTLPGCPPWETIVDFWTDAADGNTQRHHCKVFKPAPEVLADDLPPGWMKAALAVQADIGCACC